LGAVLFEIIIMKRIEWTYEGTMKYKRYNGMWYQKFYDVNKEEIEKYMTKKCVVTEKMFQERMKIMYTDIIEWD